MNEERNYRSLFWEPYKTQKYTVWAEKRALNAAPGGKLCNHQAINR